MVFFSLFPDNPDKSLIFKFVSAGMDFLKGKGTLIKVLRNRLLAEAEIDMYRNFVCSFRQTAALIGIQKLIQDSDVKPRH